MLPPGHIAGGYLVTRELLKVVPYHFNHEQTNWLYFWGMFFAFSPDLDFFYTFFKQKKFTGITKDNNHRDLLSHVPILWFIGSAILFLLSRSDFMHMVAILLWACSWSHFLLDSIQDGVMWLWPLTRKRFALIPIKNPVDFSASIANDGDKSFFGYWWYFTKQVAINLPILVSCEILLIIIAVLTYAHVI